MELVGRLCFEIQIIIDTEADVQVNALVLALF